MQDGFLHPKRSTDSDSRERPAIFKLTTMKLLLLSLIATGCSTYTCPTLNGKEPRNKTRHFISYKKVPEGYLVTEKKGFIVTHFITDCKPCK